jgi:hypothetical protein
VVLLTVPALVPLLRVGFFQSHDGLIHVYRLAALDGAVRSGVLYPRWFPHFAFGYGHPVLNFYGPLSYYWGLPFTLLHADAALALKLVLAMGLVASALGMYLFARLHLDRCPALVAAVVYAYLPYHLVDLYVRGAVAEFLAFVWFPLVLWSFHRLITGAAQPGLQRLALAALLFAALVATHSLSAFIFAPLMAVYIVLLLLQERNSRATASVVLASGLALAVSAAHWLPVLVEAQWVGLGHGTSQGYQEHLVSWIALVSLHPFYPYPSGEGTAPTFPLGLIQILTIAAALLLLFRRGQSQRPSRWMIWLFLALALFSAFMLTTASLPVWRVFEWGLAFLQYPWRFQALTALAAAFLAGALVQGMTPLPRQGAPSSRTTAAICAGFLVATGVWALWRLPVVPMTADPSTEAMWQRDREVGQVGATWTGEYLPIWVTEQRWALSHPTSGDTATGTDTERGPYPPGQVKLASVGYTRYDLVLNAAEEVSVALHQFHYPGWQAEDLDGNMVYDSQPAGILGLAAFELPPGDGSFALRLALTPAQLWGTLISLVTSLVMVVALVFQTIRQPRRARPRLILAGCYLLLATVLVASLILPNGVARSVEQVNANLEGSVELLGLTTDRTSYHPGDTAYITLYWRALRDLDENYKAYVHLTDAALTRQPAQHDGDPGGGFTPTTRWLPGELVADTHALALPGDLAPGRYFLWAGMYEYAAVRNLAVLSAGVPSDSNRLLVGEIEVEVP